MCRFFDGDIQPLAGIGSNLYIYDVSISYKGPELLFAGTNSGVYKSINDGLYWIPVNNTLPEQGLDLECTSVQVSPWQPTEVFALCNGEVFQTKDLGANWTRLDSPENLDFLHAMAQPKILLAATQNDGLWGYQFP